MSTFPSLVDDLMAQLQGAPLQQMAQQLGTSPAQTQDAVGAALPLLLGKLGRNASEPQGAMDLFGALQRDHTGGNDLERLLGSLLGGSGGGLGQVLGQEHARVQQQGGLGEGLLGSLLDQDGDGQVGLSDLMKIGGGLLGGRRQSP